MVFSAPWTPDELRLLEEQAAVHKRNWSKYDRRQLGGRSKNAISKYARSLAKGEIAGEDADKWTALLGEAVGRRKLPFVVLYDGNNALCFDCEENLAYCNVPGWRCPRCGVAKYGQDPHPSGTIPLMAEVEGGDLLLGAAIPWINKNSELTFIFSDEDDFALTHPDLLKQEYAELREERKKMCRARKSANEIKTALKAAKRALRRQEAGSARATQGASQELLNDQLAFLEEKIAQLRTSMKTLVCICVGEREGNLLARNEAFGHLIQKQRPLEVLRRERDGTGSALVVADFKEGGREHTKWSATRLGRGDGVMTGTEALDVELYSHGVFSGHNVPGRLWTRDGNGARTCYKDGPHDCMLMEYDFVDDIRAKEVDGLALNASMREEKKQRYITDFGFDETHFVMPNYEEPRWARLYEKLIQKRRGVMDEPDGADEPVDVDVGVNEPEEEDVAVEIVDVGADEPEEENVAVEIVDVDADELEDEVVDVDVDEPAAPEDVAVEVIDEAAPEEGPVEIANPPQLSREVRAALQNVDRTKFKWPTKGKGAKKTESFLAVVTDRGEDGWEAVANGSAGIKGKRALSEAECIAAFVMLPGGYQNSKRPKIDDEAWAVLPEARAVLGVRPLD